MAELTFAKTFLATLESKPVKLRSDHVFDPRSFQMRQPYVLPKLDDSHPRLPKRVKTTEAPGSSKAVTIHLKAARNPVLEVTLDKMSVSTTTIQDLKEAVQARIKPTGSGEGTVPLDKIKILWKRKPVQGKTLAEVLAGESGLLSGGGHAEFGVMILGGATALSPEEIKATTKPTETPTRPAEGGAEDVKMEDVRATPEQAPSGEGVLGQAAFWDDLQQFLQSKVNDEQEATRLKSLFKGAWESNR